MKQMLRQFTPHVILSEAKDLGVIPAQAGIRSHRPRWPARRSFTAPSRSLWRSGGGGWPAVLTVTLAAVFLFLPAAAQAATLYWVGAAGGNTSVARICSQA